MSRPAETPQAEEVTQAAADACVPLSLLSPGMQAVLCRQHQNGSLPTRLKDLGFVPGTRLIVVRTAPLGDPLEIEIRGSRFCLRRENIAGICVRPEADASTGEAP